MKHVLAILLSSLLFVACGASGPQGTYRLDTDAMLAAMSEHGKDNPGMAMMATMMKDAKIEMTFAADGTMTGSSEMSMMGQTKKNSMKGTWKLEGTQLTMTQTEEDGKAKADTKVGTFADGKITLSGDKAPDAPPVEMVFVKK